MKGPDEVVTPNGEARAVGAAPGFWVQTTKSECDCAVHQPALQTASRRRASFGARKRPLASAVFGPLTAARIPITSAAEHRQVSSAFATDAAFRLARKRLMGLGVGLYRTDARDAQVKYFVSFRKRIKRRDSLGAALNLAEQMLMECAQ